MEYQAYIVLSVIVYQEKDGRWTAKCPDLGTSTFGNTIDEAEKEIEEMINLHIQTLSDVGELENFLAERNIKIYKKELPREIPLNFQTIRNKLTKTREYPIPNLAH